MFAYFEVPYLSTAGKGIWFATDVFCCLWVEFACEFGCWVALLT